MTRTTISLPGELLERLRRLALDQNRSMAAVMREALEEKAALHRPKPKSLGIGASGHSNTSRTLATERLEPRSWR